MEPIVETIEDGDLKIIVAGPTGFANNVYILVDRNTNDAVFIDAPDVDVCAAAAEAAGVRPQAIWLTHSHGDHTAGIDGLRERYGCKVIADANEPWLKEGQLDQAVTQDDRVKVGGLEFRALSVPGHTPGSTTFVNEKHAFVGDTLFPGGPGHSRSNDLLQQEIRSITSQLYALDDGTVIYPGHGSRTTIGASKAEYAVFAGKSHAADLHGDVLWLES